MLRLFVYRWGVDDASLPYNWLVLNPQPIAHLLVIWIEHDHILTHLLVTNHNPNKFYSSWAKKKKPPTFQYTGCLIGILISWFIKTSS